MKQKLRQTYNEYKVRPNLDTYYGLYDSIEEALKIIPRRMRSKGRTVGVIEDGSVVEYWFESGIEDSDLIVKNEGGGTSFTGIETEDSDTVAFTGNGTAGTPLKATSTLTLEQARQNGNILEGSVEFVLGKDPIKIFNNFNRERGIDFKEDGYLDFYVDDKSTKVSIGTDSITLQSDSEEGGTNISINNSNGIVSIYSTIPDSKGVTGSQEFNKQGDRKAFAQLSDVYDPESLIQLLNDANSTQLATIKGLLGIV